MTNKTKSIRICADFTSHKLNPYAIRLATVLARLKSAGTSKENSSTYLLKVYCSYDKGVNSTVSKLIDTQHIANAFINKWDIIDITDIYSLTKRQSNKILEEAKLTNAEPIPYLENLYNSKRCVPERKIIILSGDNSESALMEEELNKKKGKEIAEELLVRYIQYASNSEEATYLDVCLEELEYSLIRNWLIGNQLRVEEIATCIMNNQTCLVNYANYYINNFEQRKFKEIEKKYEKYCEGNEEVANILRKILLGVD